MTVHLDKHYMLPVLKYKCRSECKNLQTVYARAFVRITFRYQWFNQACLDYQ
jgi:ribosomal protein S27E